MGTETKRFDGKDYRKKSGKVTENRVSLVTSAGTRQTIFVDNHTFVKYGGLTRGIISNSGLQYSHQILIISHNKTILSYITPTKEDAYNNIMKINKLFEEARAFYNKYINQK